MMMMIIIIIIIIIIATYILHKYFSVKGKQIFILFKPNNKPSVVQPHLEIHCDIFTCS